MSFRTYLKEHLPPSFAHVLGGMWWGGVAAGVIYPIDRAVIRRYPQSVAFWTPRRGVSRGRSLFLMVGVLPVGEEMLYRGALRDVQREPEESALQMAQRMVVNSALFTVGHFNFRVALRHNLRIAGPIFLSGMAFNGVTELTGNLWGAIFGHSMVNFIAFRRIFR